VNKIQGHSQDTITSFEQMSQDVADTAGSNQQVLQYNEQQTGQVTQLSQQFQELFSALENSANKADSTSLIAESVYNNADSLLQSVRGYTVSKVAVQSMRDGQEKRLQPRTKSNVNAVLSLASGLKINVLIEDMSVTGCKVISKKQLEEKSVTINLRIPSADMNSYAKQQELELNATIAHRGKAIVLDNNDRRHQYGLEFKNISTADKKQLMSLMSYYVEIA
jgi:hypothetical protein